MAVNSLARAVVDREIEEIVLRHREAVVPSLVFRPDGAGPWPAIVLSAEAYGINEFTREVGGRLADAGYVRRRRLCEVPP